jgi:hypothetical protein
MNNTTSDKKYIENMKKFINKNFSIKDLRDINKQREYKLSKKEEDFVGNIEKLIKNGEINPSIPDSIINQEIYKKLTIKEEKEINFLSVSICANIRQLERNIKHNSPTHSIETKSLISYIFSSINNTEKLFGNVFKI